MRLIALMFLAHLGSPETPLSEGVSAKVTVTAQQPWVIVVRHDDESPEQAIVPAGEYRRRQRDSTLTLVRLEKPVRTTLTFTGTATGFTVEGAPVRRIVVPKKVNVFSVYFPREGVVEVWSHSRNGCPGNVWSSLYAVRGSELVEVLNLHWSGETSWWEGQLVQWSANERSSSLGFPMMELVPGIPAGEQLAVIDESIENETQVICSTRKRYRLKNAELTLIDTTDAPDAGCRHE